MTVTKVGAYLLHGRAKSASDRKKSVKQTIVKVKRERGSVKKEAIIPDGPSL
jgi:hypothetical protein